MVLDGFWVIASHCRGPSRSFSSTLFSLRNQAKFLVFGTAGSRTWKVKFLVFYPLWGLNVGSCPPEGCCHAHSHLGILDVWVRFSQGSSAGVTAWSDGQEGSTWPWPAAREFVFPDSLQLFAEAFLHRHVPMDCLCSPSAELWDCTEVKSKAFYQWNSSLSVGDLSPGSSKGFAWAALVLYLLSTSVWWTGTFQWLRQTERGFSFLQYSKEGRELAFRFW